MASKTVAQLGEHPHGEVAGSSPAGQLFSRVHHANTASRGETRPLRGETLRWSVERVTNGPASRT